MHAPAPFAADRLGTASIATSPAPRWLSGLTCALLSTSAFASEDAGTTTPGIRLVNVEAPDSSSPVGALESIVGGEQVPTCKWPGTVGLSANFEPERPTESSRVEICTGTLVHPEIVITAAHCVDTGVIDILVGENNKSAARHIGFSYCKAVSRGPESRRDFAYCKLSQKVTDVPIVPILMGCEIDVLQPGTEIVGVGFGVTRPNETTGPKRFVKTRFNNFIGSGLDREAAVGERGKGWCFGDSGGPAYVKLPEDKFGKDAGWRVFGVTSRGTDASCPGDAILGMMSNFVQFVESDSGIDVTPCHDADGTWNPGPGCEAAPLDPFAGGGSWSGGCDPGPLGGKIVSCGANDGGDESGDDAADEGSEDADEGTTGDDTEETGDDTEETEETGDDTEDTGETGDGESEADGDDTEESGDDSTESGDDDDDESGDGEDEESGDDTKSDESGDDTKSDEGGDEKGEDEGSKDVEDDGGDDDTKSDEGGGGMNESTTSSEADGTGGCSVTSSGAGVGWMSLLLLGLARRRRPRA